MEIFREKQLSELNFLDTCYYNFVDGAGGETRSSLIIYLNSVFEAENKRYIYNFVEIKPTGPEYLQIFSDDDAVLQKRITVFVADLEVLKEKNLEFEIKFRQNRQITLAGSVGVSGIVHVTGVHEFSG